MLVVDDSAGALRSLARALKEKERTILLALDRAEAIEHARRGAIDLAIVDLRLASDNGLDVIDAIWSVAPRLHAVILSGLLGDDAERRAARMGVLCFDKFICDSREGVLNLIRRLERGSAEALPSRPPALPSPEEAIRRYYAGLVEACDGNVSLAARVAGVSRNTVKRNVLRRGGGGDGSQERSDGEANSDAASDSRAELDK